MLSYITRLTDRVAEDTFEKTVGRGYSINVEGRQRGQQSVEMGREEEHGQGEKEGVGVPGREAAGEGEDTRTDTGGLRDLAEFTPTMQ